MAAEVDLAIFNEAKEHAEELAQSYSQRDKEYGVYEKMYLMDWEDKPNLDNIKITISPDPRNAILGVVRLMTMADPIVRVPDDMGEEYDTASRIEQALKRWWHESGMIANIPLHRDAVLSGALYGEVHISITSTFDMLEYLKKRGGKKEMKSVIARAEKLVERTPFLFEVWNPKNGYPEFDSLGLCAYYRKVSVTKSRLVGQYGSLAADIVAGMNNTETKTLSIFYDTVNYAVWVDNTPIIAIEHELPEIPVSVVLTDGSMIYDKPEYQRQPFLYGVRKAGLWERQNLVLTVLYTSLFNLGLNPTFIHVAPPNKPDKEIYYDASKMGGVLNLEAGEQFQLMNTEGIIDNAMMNALTLADKKSVESTIYRQAIGESLEGSFAFSSLALLAQNGQLPLTPLKRQVALAIKGAFVYALNMYRDNGKKSKYSELDPKEVPERPVVEVDLELTLPQDKLQSANIAQLLVKYDIASASWTRQNILNIEQPEKMEEEILSEKVFAALVANYIQTKLSQMTQQQQIQGEIPLGMPQNPENGSETAHRVPSLSRDIQEMMQKGQISPEMMQILSQNQGMQPQMMPQEGIGGAEFNPAMGGTPPVQAEQVPDYNMGMENGKRRFVR